MAELTPLFMDISNVYSGDDLGLPWRDVIGEGIVDASDLAVTQNGAGADLSVDIAAGAAWVTGDTNPDAQPTYRVRNDATVNLGISPDASNPRKVLIVAQVTDETFADVGRQWALEAIHGTPAATPAEPALPDSALKLAVITVPAGASSIVNANIADARVRAEIGKGGAPASGAQLGYLELTSFTAAPNGTWNTLIGDLTVECDGGEVWVECFLPSASTPSVAGGLIEFAVWLDGAQEVILGFLTTPAAGVMKAPCHLKQKIKPSAGSHTFAIKLSASSTTGAPSAGGGTGTVPSGFPPAFLRVTRA